MAAVSLVLPARTAPAIAIYTRVGVIGEAKSQMLGGQSMCVRGSTERLLITQRVASPRSSLDEAMSDRSVSASMLRTDMAEADPIERTSAGQHEVRYDHRTGFIHVVHVGMMDGEEARRVNDAAIRYGAYTPANVPSYVIADNTRAGGMTSEARKLLAARAGMHEEAYVVLFGASFVVRVMMNLLMKAQSLTSPKLQANAVATEAEALAWLNDRKQAFQARMPSTAEGKRN